MGRLPPSLPHPPPPSPHLLQVSSTIPFRVGQWVRIWVRSPGNQDLSRRRLQGGFNAPVDAPAPAGTAPAGTAPAVSPLVPLMFSDPYIQAAVAAAAAAEAAEVAAAAAAPAEGDAADQVAAFSSDPAVLAAAAEAEAEQLNPLRLDAMVLAAARHGQWAVLSEIGEGDFPADLLANLTGNGTADPGAGKTDAQASRGGRRARGRRARGAVKCLWEVPWGGCVNRLPMRLMHAAGFPVCAGRAWQPGLLPVRRHAVRRQRRGLRCAADAAAGPRRAARAAVAAAAAAVPALPLGTFAATAAVANLPSCSLPRAGVFPKSDHIRMASRVAAIGDGWIELERPLPWDLRRKWQVGDGLEGCLRGAAQLGGDGVRQGPQFVGDSRSCPCLHTLSGAASSPADPWRPHHRHRQRCCPVLPPPAPPRSPCCTPLPPACSTAAWRDSPSSSTGVSGGGDAGNVRDRQAGKQAGRTCCMLIPSAQCCRRRPLSAPCPAAPAAPLRLPAAPFPDHFFAGGANAIVLYDVANCWVRDVSNAHARSAAHRRLCIN